MKALTQTEACQQGYARLIAPSETAHKYSRGKLVVVAGSAAYPGAACLAAYAAQRAGAGYVEVFCAPESVPILRSYRPSLVVRPWTDLKNLLPLASRAGHPCACLVGPGFDAADPECAAIFDEVLRGCDAPLVVDGGALALLADAERIRLFSERRKRDCASVLCPHGGEAARLAAALGCALTRAATDEEQLRIAESIAAGLGAVVVSKAANTCVVGEGTALWMTQGGAELAKAGTGDVLAGIVGALVATGCSPLEAGFTGALLHALSGNLAAEELGRISVVPEDLIDYLPFAIGQLGKNTNEE